MAVNRWVAGSNPARGANFLKGLAEALPSIKLCPLLPGANSSAKSSRAGSDALITK